jgi:MYND finger
MLFKVLLFIVLITTNKSVLACAHEGCVIGDTELKLCSGCKEIRYCSVEHQINDWKTHKGRCLQSRKSRLSRLNKAIEDPSQIKKINPNFGQDGYSNNCDFCVNLYAFFLKFGNLGYYKQGAIPFFHIRAMFDQKYHQEYLQKNITLCWSLFPEKQESNDLEVIEAARVPAESIATINDALSHEDNTTVYLVKGYRAYAVGEARLHSWVAFKVDGVIYHKCPQSGTNLPFAFSEFVSFSYYPIR